MKIKQEIILWIAGLILTFLTGYFYSATDDSYPVTGTIGIEGKKVSYKFDKQAYSKEGYTFIIRTDLPDLKAELQWRLKEDPHQWNFVPMSSSIDALIGTIPPQQALTKIEYRTVIAWKGYEYIIPSGKPVELTFWGSVPGMITFLFYFTLFAGLLGAIRTGLEYFSSEDKIKKFALFTTAFFFLHSLAVNPLKKTFELDALNMRVPAITELFDVQSISLLILWILLTILSFRLRQRKIIALTGACFTILIYLLIRF
jgi:hypothetical protein